MDGARRVKPEIVQAVQAVLPQIALPGLPPPSIVPTVRGGVQLEWHARGVDLEVEANSPDLLQVLYDDQGESTELGLGVERSDLDRLRELTARVGRCQ